MNNIAQNNFILDNLNIIFMNRFSIDLKIKTVEDFDKLLIGIEFCLEPRDLVYIYLDIESSFAIKIPDEEVAKEGLSTINHIIALISRQLDKNIKITI